MRVSAGGFRTAATGIDLSIEQLLPHRRRRRLAFIRALQHRAGSVVLAALSDRITLEAELKDWISVGGAVNPQNGEPFAGNVLEYGIGLGYDWRRCGRWTITPIVEFVGWTVLEGQVSEFDAQGNELGPADAAGDTIVNMKLGARITDCCGSSFYAGYGRSLTGDRWYEDIIRVEFRRPF